MSDELEILTAEELLAMGQRLKAMRQQLGLKQNELAREIGLSASYISDIEKGKTNPGFSIMLRLHRKYKVSLDWLLFSEGEMFCGVGENGTGKLPGFDFGDQSGRIYEMLSIMDRSPFFLSYMVSQYLKSKYDFEAVIAKELEKTEPAK